MNLDLFRWFDLRQDQAPAADIDSSIRSGARAGGTNLWVLFFAMLIASVGLNVNSTAVIIGAMLISPLMGPIVGVGYGAAVADLRLIRTAGLNLLVFAALSLLASTLYFTLSPLNEPGSELLARTSPSLWDVLIAAFGGAAGMVAITRRSFNNIVPGVAIATALMPPLCTVGFGIAHRRWDMAAGALFLFLINSVFIAVATLTVARILRLPSVAELDLRTRALHRGVIGLGLVVVLVPSVWMGYRLVQDEVFQGAAQRALEQLERTTGTALLGKEIEPRARTIRLTVLGEAEQARLVMAVRPLLAAQRIADAKLEFRRAGDVQLTDMNRLGNERDQKLGALTNRLQELTQKLDAVSGERPPRAQALLQELRAWLPAATGLLLTDAANGSREVRIQLTHALTPHDLRQLRTWLVARLGDDAFSLIQEASHPPTKP
ncbi:MAG: DUF389 domain-containing protein [Burkholderiales bacterium]